MQIPSPTGPPTGPPPTGTPPLPPGSPPGPGGPGGSATTLEMSTGMRNVSAIREMRSYDFFIFEALINAKIVIFYYIDKFN